MRRPSSACLLLLFLFLTLVASSPATPAPPLLSTDTSAAFASSSTSFSAHKPRWGSTAPSSKRLPSPFPSLSPSSTRSIQSLGTGLLLPLFLFLQNAHASPFDPHPLPFLLGLCFFNGWYIRVTDHDKGLAFALIVGSFKHPGK